MNTSEIKINVNSFCDVTCNRKKKALIITGKLYEI